MSNTRVWKQVSHVKHVQFPDNQSSISHSRSSVNYQFNKVPFSKTKIQPQQVPKKRLGLSSIVKAKQKYKQRNTNPLLKKTSFSSSLASLLDQQPINLTLKQTSHRKIESKLRRFLLNIKKVHFQLKSLAQNMLATFQQIKEEMEINLIKVTDQIVKVNSQLKGVEQIHEILHHGFQTVRKSIILPLQSLSHFNGLSQKSSGQKKKIIREQPMTPLLRANKQSNGKRSQPKYSQIFSSELVSPILFKHQTLNLQSTQNKPKIRAQTQRRRYQLTTSFDKQPQQATQRKKYDIMSVGSNESTQNIQNIIMQMRQILNE